MYLLYTSFSLIAQDALKAPVAIIQSKNNFGLETGTGCIVGQKDNFLYILTVAHVIENSKEINVQLFKDWETKGELVKIHDALDIAAIKCKVPTGFTIPRSFGLSKEPEKVLQKVIVIGHPLGNQWDINYNTNIKTEEYDLDERLFTLAPIGIVPGNSGGPILTQQYELLGLVQKVNPVKAICVDVNTLLKAAQVWEIPVNLLLGIKLKKEKADAGEDDFRYELIVQEANSAFADKKWEQAKRAFIEANNLVPSESFENKIQECEIEISKDIKYDYYLKQGHEASNLQSALSSFQQAQQQRNTEKVRNLIQQTKEKLAILEIDIPKESPNSRTQLPMFITDSLAGNFALIEGGTFTMGCDTCEENQWPAHQVYLDDFYIGTSEVSGELFCQYLNEEKQHEKVDFTNIKVHKRGKYWFYEPVHDVRGTKYPPDFNPMDYWEMQKFVWWLSEKTGHVYRLPTEAEWEYAARKISKDGKLNSNNMFQGNLEWCSDYYDPIYYKACKEQGVVANPKGPLSGPRILRGNNLTSRNLAERFPHSAEYPYPKGALRLVKVPYAIHSGKTIPISLFEDKMVLVKGGSFKLENPLGGKDNNPVHSVTLGDFYISSTEVTFDEWEAIMENPPNNKPFPSYKWGQPITSISWNNIQKFINKLNLLTGMNYRLPTEAEWGYAAKGGRKGIHNNYIHAGSNLSKEVAWGSSYPKLVASKQPNELGLYDMSGNALEWCQDWWHQTYYSFSQVNDPLGPLTGIYKVIRGGNYNSNIEFEHPSPIHERQFQYPEYYDESIGFRLARSAKGNLPTSKLKDPFEKDMLVIQEGVFNEYKFVESFTLSKFEVTQEQWKKIAGYNPSEYNDCSQCPVTNIGYRDVMRFIKSLNQATGKRYRLPTAKEWEYAAGGGDTDRTIFSGTSNDKKLYKYANYGDRSYALHYTNGLNKKKDGHSNLAPIGSYLPNSLGLYDMTGNVREFCHKIDHTGSRTPYVRGGDWESSEITRLRITYSYEFKIGTSERSDVLGFRLAHDIAQ